MNKKILKKAISIFICIILVLLPNINYANAASSKELVDNLDYLKLNKKILNEIDNNTAPEVIIENLSVDEINILQSAYETSTESTYTGFNGEVTNNPEIQIIDNLASEYYEYYVVYGELPKIDSEYTPLADNYLMDNNTFITTNSYAGDYSELMKQLGYTFTLSDIAMHLVQIGNYLNIGSALPFLNLVALIVGMGFIVIGTIAIAYSAVAVGANNLILQWYTNASVNLTLARQNTAAIIAQRENGAKYWRAYLANWGGLGGIRVGDPISLETAASLIRVNTMSTNVFTYDYFYAITAANAAYGYGASGPECHNSVYLLNFQHVHALLSPNINHHGKSHIFFAFPVYF
ncbi:hypothetical protein acsn021_12100 [Anaerocolumna cellulosilytica]|uniref:Uncharacterized protein n=1 Tax=Anaerocolumna cellulosilytica TaxID=433286 RepID=A0A6S6R3D0_9FIRM|nr:hypothetical protein [Anaerocolumna cellulosilytica]MBB5196056.1 hypothetical protein [Anaerocolumna cellulosilytica]BCJ93641.1 hypothetical protein acsn021_12100 [Anaerocolumna cellulosilytica]